MRTWADVRDAVRAYFMIVTVNPVPGAYYNIGGTFSCTVEDMLAYLISISTCPDSIRVETEQARLRPLDADLQIPDITKFRTHTGWQPEIPFEKTMQDLLDYWRERVQYGKHHLIR
jgi:nucleoside-diphosphate-sugar epimerase